MIYYKDDDARRFRDMSRYLPRGVHLNVIDYKRMREIDRFYCLCQEHRDYYKDRTGKVKSVPFFKEYPKKYETRSVTDDFATAKVTYKTVEQPIFYSYDWF